MLITHKEKIRINHRSCFLLNPVHTMPPLSLPTEIVVSGKIYLEIYVKNSKFYYSRSATESAMDFNQTSEVFGTSETSGGILGWFGPNEDYIRIPGRYPVLSGKAVKVMIEQAGIGKNNFIPVHVTEDKEI